MRRRERAGFAVVVLTVGQQHERLVMAFFLERRQRGVDGLGDGRAAFGDGIHVQRLHALLERRVVNRQRTFQKRITRERDESHAIRARALHQFQRGEFRTFETVRRDVGCEHGLRRVNRDDDVQTVLLHFFQIESMLRSRERNNQKYDGQN